jgi:hypothetical protein
MTVKARRAAAFLSWYFYTSLHEDRFGLHAGIRCHFLFHKHVSVFFSIYWFSTQKKKKKLGRRCGIFIFSSDSFSDIACVFA